MIDTPQIHPTVVRTERGLSVAGTRITLYAILDYLHAEWPPHLIRDWLGLTDIQMNGVLTYLDDHRDEVEREYEQVVQQAEANRRYWEQRNREHPSRPVAQPSPEQAALRARVQVWKEQLAKR